LARDATRVLPRFLFGGRPFIACLVVLLARAPGYRARVWVDARGAAAGATAISTIDATTLETMRFTMVVSLV
jgi:hypothetical protein